MSDLDTYLNHCYDLLLKAEEIPSQKAVDEELCACATLVKRDNLN